MKSNSLTWWIFIRFSLFVVIVSFIIAWQQSSAVNDFRVRQIESQLGRSAVEIAVNPEKTFKSPYSYTLLNEDGSVFKDDNFGSVASLGASKHFHKALKGESELVTEQLGSRRNISVWMPLQLEGKKYVLVLRETYKISYFKGFLANFLLYVIGGLLGAYLFFSGSFSAIK